MGVKYLCSVKVRWRILQVSTLRTRVSTELDVSSGWVGLKWFFHFLSVNCVSAWERNFEYFTEFEAASFQITSSDRFSNKECVLRKSPSWFIAKSWFHTVFWHVGIYFTVSVYLCITTCVKLKQGSSLCLFMCIYTSEQRLWYFLKHFVNSVLETCFISWGTENAANKWNLCKSRNTFTDETLGKLRTDKYIGQLSLILTSLF